MNPIDRILNAFTMYKVVLFGLMIELVWSVIAALAGWIDLPFYGILLSFVIAFAFGFSSNRILAKLYHAPANSESWGISALIIVFIMPLTVNPRSGVMIALTVVLAMASKYVIQYRYQHLFNPAAFAVTVVGLFGLSYATWWIGAPALLPATLLIGAAVVRKIRRIEMTLLFAGASILTTVIILASGSGLTTQALLSAIFSSPFIFLGTIMLTEPSTMPHTRQYRNVFALMVGVLSSLQVALFGVSLSAQIALLIANIFGIIVSRRPKVQLTLVRRTQLSATIWDYVFKPSHPVMHMAGQYMDWTLPHRGEDVRGNRRTFTIASAPHEREVRLGIRFDPDHSSSFKRALQSLQPGDTISTGQVDGRFTLPTDTTIPLVWIAGGVGITPFRSMAMSLDTVGTKKVELFYLARSVEEFAYRDDFTKIAALTSHYLAGTELDESALRASGIDFDRALFYIAGSPAMVDHYRKLLRGLGIDHKRIVTDHFSGY